MTTEMWVIKLLDYELAELPFKWIRNSECPITLNTVKFQNYQMEINQRLKMIRQRSNTWS